MWFHLDQGDYKFAHVGVATAKRPQGPFTFEHGLLPDGKMSEDMSLFRDPQDGQAYFVRSVANQYTAISRLTSDYLNSTGIISNHSVFEGMALFRHANGTYPLPYSRNGAGPSQLSQSNPLGMAALAGRAFMPCGQMGRFVQICASVTLPMIPARTNSTARARGIFIFGPQS